jgi:hypothetical protein
MGPGHFGFDGHSSSTKMLAPGFQVTFGDTEGYVTGAACAMEWNGAAIDNHSLALSALRIEQEQNA